MQIFHKTYRGPKGGLKRAKTWTVRFYVNGRRFERSLGTRDKTAAEMKAAALIRAEELRAAGIETHHEVRDVALRDLVDEYEGELLRRGRTKRHVQVVASRLRKLTSRVASLTHLTPERIRRSLGRLQVSPRTMNFYRQALHQFFVWLVQEGRWATNPVDAIPTVRVVEPTRVRRALTDDELAALLAATPEPRDALYLMAARTGLRRSELRALTWDDVDLDEGLVTVRARSAKNRKHEVQPLTPATVDRLRILSENADPGAPVFTCNPRVEVLKKDLAAAGIAFETSEGVVDFHALRATYGTSLARAGVTLALAQKLMRHSTPVLTANVYTKLELHDRQDAVARLDPAGEAGGEAPRRQA